MDSPTDFYACYIMLLGGVGHSASCSGFRLARGAVLVRASLIWLGRDAFMLVAQASFGLERGQEEVLHRDSAGRA